MSKIAVISGLILFVLLICLPAIAYDDQAVHYYGEGTDFMELGRFSEAVASFDKAIAICPDYYDAWNTRGAALCVLGRYKEAVASFDKAIAINPNNFNAWYNRGVALGVLGRYSEAVASYDKAIAINPNNFDAVNDRKVILKNLVTSSLATDSFISIDRIGDKYIGDKFTITAQTNLAVDDEVLFEVYSSSFKPTEKTQSGMFTGATGTVKVTNGYEGMNKISFDLDLSTLYPDEYVVTESAVDKETTGTALFKVLDRTAPTAVPTPVKTTAAQTTVISTTVIPTVAPTQSNIPTQPSPLGLEIGIIATIGAVLLVIKRK